MRCRQGTSVRGPFLCHLREASVHVAGGVGGARPSPGWLQGWGSSELWTSFRRFCGFTEPTVRAVLWKAKEKTPVQIQQDLMGTGTQCICSRVLVCPHPPCLEHVSQLKYRYSENSFSIPLLLSRILFPCWNLSWLPLLFFYRICHNFGNFDFSS